MTEIKALNNVFYKTGPIFYKVLKHIWLYFTCA